MGYPYVLSLQSFLLEVSGPMSVSALVPMPALAGSPWTPLPRLLMEENPSRPSLGLAPLLCQAAMPAEEAAPSCLCLFLLIVM